MVNEKISIKLIILILIFLAGFTINYTIVKAAEYNIRHQWVKVWINKDGTIDLLYDVEIMCTEGSISRVDIGQPTKDFTIGWARDENGLALNTQDISSGEYYAVRVFLQSSISSSRRLPCRAIKVFSFRLDNLRTLTKALLACINFSTPNTLFRRSLRVAGDLMMNSPNSSSFRKQPICHCCGLRSGSAELSSSIFNQLSSW